MKKSTGKCLRFYILLWIQPDIYPCIFADSEQNNNTLCPTGFRPLNVESPGNCSFTLFNDSSNLEYALHKLQWEDGKVQRIITDIKITKNDTRRKSCQSMLPNKWLLSYIDPNGPYDFVSWSSDFKVLSLGLVNEDPDITVKINETSGRCAVVEGGNYMISEIVKLFTGFIREKVELDKRYDYENINLCYLSKFKWFEKSGWYWAKRLFGIPFQQFGYKCCMVRKETVCCDDKLHRVEGYRLLPYIISICLLSYSPILLMRLANFCNTYDDNTSQRIDNNHTQQSSNQVSVLLRFPFFLRFCYYTDVNSNQLNDDNGGQSNQGRDAQNARLIPPNGIGECNDNDDYDYYCFLDCQCCFDIPECNCNCFPCCDWFFKRLKSLTFVFILFPSMIYIEFFLLMIDDDWKELLQTIGKNELLFGFPTMLGSIKSTMFLPPEGPMGALIIYYILGFCIIVLPEDFENSVIGQGISVFHRRAVNQNSASNGGMGPTNQSMEEQISKGYLRVKIILQNLMYLPLNAMYWKRGRSRLMKVCRLILLPLFVFPIIPFSFMCLVGWIRYIFKKLDDKCNCSFCYNSLKIFVLFILSLVLMIFYGIFVVMLSYSIYLLFYILFFASWGFVISPNIKSKFIIFILGALVFEFQIIRDSIHFYTEFFHLIVEICQSDYSLKEKYITYQQKGQYINENLVTEVFRKVRPAFVQTGHVIIKTIIVSLMYASAFTFMSKFTENISDIIERLTILITSVTPIMLQWKFKTICPNRLRVEHIIRQCVIEAERNEQNAEEGEIEQNYEEATRKFIEAEKKAKDAVQKSKEAKRITHEAKEVERIAKEAERNAKEAERKDKINELTAKEAKLNTKKDTLDTKECDLNIKEDKLNTKETELNIKEHKLNTKETQLGIEETRLQTERTELKAINVAKPTNT